jgi:hypothetical protein
MREDTEEEKKLKARIAVLEHQMEYDLRVVAVLVAVGALSESKLAHAREIVSGLSH